MSLSPRTWGWIQYLAFLGLFVSLLAAYWAYFYEVATNLGDMQTPTYPYRGHIILPVLVSCLLLGVFAYSGIRKR